jgi:hypothetical protein
MSGISWLNFLTKTSPQATDKALRRKIRLIESNAKCRHLKLICKRTLRQVFICLRPEPLTPPPPTYFTHSMFIHTGMGWGGTVEPERRLEGQHFTQLGRKYQHDWLYLPVYNSAKAAKSPSGSIFLDDDVLFWCQYSLLVHDARPPLRGVEGMATAVSGCVHVSADVNWYVWQWNYIIVVSSVRCSGGKIKVHASPLFAGGVKRLVGLSLEAISQEVDCMCHVMARSRVQSDHVRR